SAARMMGGNTKKEGVTSLGAEHDFRMSIFRAQVDAPAELACILETGRSCAGCHPLTFVGDVGHF
ncbi:hypothetical protein HOY82DRAFT_475008, partial [Tuber indicum]